MNTIQEFNQTFTHLVAEGDEAAALEVYVGRKCVFKKELQEEAARKRYGTVIVGSEWEIIGVQRIWNGSLSLRAKNLGVEHCFGRPVHLHEIDFVDTH